MKKNRTFLKSKDLRVRPMEPSETASYLSDLQDDFFDIVKKNQSLSESLFEEKNRGYFLLTLWDISLVDKTKNATSIGKVFFHGDKEAGSVEISIRINEDYRNRKYGTRVLEMLSEWAFAQKDIYEIHAHFDDQNSAAIRSFTRAGFVYRETVSHIEHYSVTKDPTSWRGLYVILGVWIGCIIAMIINHIIIGVLIGIFLGFCLGFWLDNQDLKHREEVMGTPQKKRKKNKDK